MLIGSAPATHVKVADTILSGPHGASNSAGISLAENTSSHENGHYLCLRIFRKNFSVHSRTCADRARSLAENIQEALKEIRMALLEADVNFKVVKQFIDRVQEKAVGQEVLTALSPAQQVVKIVHDELVDMLGKDTAKLKFASQPPSVILMAGLQGSGKTTTSENWQRGLKKADIAPCWCQLTFIVPRRASS